MRKLFTACVLLLSMPFAISSNSITDEEALNFFKLYQKMIQERSTTVMQLLSKDADLYSKTYTPSGNTFVTKYEMEEVLKFIRTVQSYIYLNAEQSEFEKVRLSRNAQQVIIQAQRFSNTHCYLDKEYKLIIERERNFIKVIEEMISIDSDATCESLESIDLNSAIK